jgi:hypothetical protein
MEDSLAGWMPADIVTLARLTPKLISAIRTMETFGGPNTSITLSMVEGPLLSANKLVLRQQILGVPFFGGHSKTFLAFDFPRLCSSANAHYTRVLSIINEDELAETLPSRPDALPLRNLLKLLEEMEV